MAKVYRIRLADTTTVEFTDTEVAKARTDHYAQRNGWEQDGEEYKKQLAWALSRPAELEDWIRREMLTEDKHKDFIENWYGPKTTRGWHEAKTAGR